MVEIGTEMLAGQSTRLSLMPKQSLFVNNYLKINQALVKLSQQDKQSKLEYHSRASRDCHLQSASFVREMNIVKDPISKYVQTCTCATNNNSSFTLA